MNLKFRSKKSIFIWALILMLSVNSTVLVVFGTTTNSGKNDTVPAVTEQMEAKEEENSSVWILAGTGALVTAAVGIIVLRWQKEKKKDRSAAKETKYFRAHLSFDSYPQKDIPKEK